MLQFVLSALGGAVGASITFVFALVLERHRRDQALVLELGKARAAAMVRVFTAVNRVFAVVTYFCINFPPDRRKPSDIAEAAKSRPLPFSADDLHGAVRALYHCAANDAVLLAEDDQLLLHRAGLLGGRALKILDAPDPDPDGFVRECMQLGRDMGDRFPEIAVTRPGKRSRRIPRPTPTLPVPSSPDAPVPDL